MQPIYCTWEANGAVAHTPGLFRRGRVTEARGWVNSAIGELATLTVESSRHPARDQEWARLWVNVPADCEIEWDADRRVLMVSRGSRNTPELETTPAETYGADEADGASCRAMSNALRAVAR